MNDDTDRTQAVNWMVEICRKSFLYPLEMCKTRMRDSDLDKWSMVESRMIEVGNRIEFGYIGCDLCRRDKGMYYYNPLAVRLWVDANEPIIKRIPQLRRVLKAAKIFDAGRRKRTRIKRQDYNSEESYEYFLDKVSRESWQQVAMVFGEMPPASNTGGK